MINLLPPVQQKEIRAAYSNGLLLRYGLLLVAAMLFLLVAFGITYYALTQISRQADETKQSNEQEAIGYATTQSAATKLRSDLTTAKTLFDNETLYSKVLVRFSGLLPEGAAVTSLDLNEESFSKPVAIDIAIKNKTAAEKLESNFKESPYITSVTLKDISTNQDSKSYPYTAALEFTLDRSIGR